MAEAARHQSVVVEALSELGLKEASLTPKGVMSSSVLAAQYEAAENVDWKIYFDAGSWDTIQSYSEKTGLKPNEVAVKLLELGKPSLERSYRIEKKSRGASRFDDLFGPPDQGLHDAFAAKSEVDRANAELIRRKEYRQQNPEAVEAKEDYLRRLANWIHRKKVLGGDNSSADREGTVEYEGEQ